MLMLSFLGGPRKLGERLKSSGKERAKHPWPFSYCFRGWRLGNRFVHRTTVSVYQYVFLRVLCSIVMLITEPLGLYHEGNWSPRYFYLYATLIINGSQMYALYGLGLFYLETRMWLKPLSPLGKFAIIKVRARARAQPCFLARNTRTSVSRFTSPRLCSHPMCPCVSSTLPTLQAVVFLTWWQGLLISLLASRHVIHATAEWSEEDVTKGLVSRAGLAWCGTGVDAAHLPVHVIARLKYRSSTASTSPAHHLAPQQDFAIVVEMFFAAVGELLRRVSSGTRPCAARIGCLFLCPASLMCT